MEEYNDIFLAGDDALVYLAEPMHQKHPTIFVWGYLFSTYVSYDQFFNPSSPCKHMYLFRVTPILLMWFHRFDSLLSFLLCSFAIVSSYCFTSEIQELMFLSQTLATSCHLIQFPVPYLGRPFRSWWLQAVSYFIFHDRWRSLAMQM